MTPQPIELAITAARPRSSAYSEREAWNSAAKPSRPGAIHVSAAVIFGMSDGSS